MRRPTRLTRIRLGLGVAALVASLGLSGCSSGSDQRDELVVWTDNLKVTGVQKVAEDFAAAEGISVRVQVISSDLQPNFVTADAAGNGPDVVVGAHDWIGNLVQNGAVDPVALTASQTEQFSDSAIQAVTYNGFLYGVPYGVEAVALYRNLAVAPDAPATLDEAFAVGQAALSAGRVESAFNLPVGQNGDAYHMQPLFTSGGGYLFGTNEEGEYVATDLGVGQPGSITAAEKIKAIGETGTGVLRRSISVDNSIALFTAGKAAFLLSGPWALPDVKKSGVQYAVTPVPGFEGAAEAEPFMGAQAFMVASHGRNKRFAQEFVSSFVPREQAMTDMNRLTGLPPSMISVAEKVGAADKDIEVFTEAAEAAAPMPAIPAMSAVWEPLGKAYAAIVGGADAASTMQVTGQTISTSIRS